MISKCIFKGGFSESDECFTVTNALKDAASELGHSFITMNGSKSLNKSQLPADKAITSQQLPLEALVCIKTKSALRCVLRKGQMHIAWTNLKNKFFLMLFQHDHFFLTFFYFNFFG